jgi:hypothetical protein
LERALPQPAEVPPSSDEISLTSHTTDVRNSSLERPWQLDGNRADDAHGVVEPQLRPGLAADDKPDIDVPPELLHGHDGSQSPSKDFKYDHHDGPAIDNIPSIAPLSQGPMAPFRGSQVVESPSSVRSSDYLELSEGLYKKDMDAHARQWLKEFYGAG